VEKGKGSEEREGKESDKETGSEEDKWNIYRSFTSGQAI